MAQRRPVAAEIGAAGHVLTDHFDRFSADFDEFLPELRVRGGLSAPNIVQEATDRDTVLRLVQCQIGIAWLTESTRWHCPRGIALIPVVDMNVRLPFNLIWKKGNSSPLLKTFVGHVQGHGEPQLKEAQITPAL